MDYTSGFKNLVDKSRILFHVTTKDGKILYLNSFGRKLLGISPGDIEAGINAGELYANPDDRKDIEHFIESEKSVFDIEIRMVSKNGKIITGHEYGYINRNDNGEEVIYGLINDISDFINLNLSTARLNMELAETNQKLQDAYSTMAQQEKMATIGELAAGVAHEINNPLGFIKSNTRSMKKYLEMLTDLFTGLSQNPVFSNIEHTGKLDFILSDLKDILEENEDGLTRIAKITDSLKRFARMGDEDVMSEFDINQAIIDTLNIAKSQYKYVAEIELNLGDIPMVFCNGDSINQVFLNLIVNAANAIESLGAKEKGKISIETLVQDDDVKFIITDSGPGIDPLVKNKIFDPFFTTKEVGKGTGLGLSLCYDIVVQKHQGRIWLENCERGGAQFNFTIPVRKVKE